MLVWTGNEATMMKVTHQVRVTSWKLIDPRQLSFRQPCPWLQHSEEIQLISCRIQACEQGIQWVGLTRDNYLYCGTSRDLTVWVISFLPQFFAQVTCISFLPQFFAHVGVPPTIYPPFDLK